MVDDTKEIGLVVCCGQVGYRRKNTAVTAHTRDAVFRCACDRLVLCYQDLLSRGYYCVVLVK